MTTSSVDYRAIFMAKVSGVADLSGNLLDERYIIPDISRDGFTVSKQGSAWNTMRKATEMAVFRYAIPLAASSDAFAEINPDPSASFPVSIEFTLTNNSGAPLSMSLSIPSNIEPYAEKSPSIDVGSSGLSGVFTAPPSGSVTATLNASISAGGVLVGGVVTGFMFPREFFSIDGSILPADFYVPVSWEISYV